MEGKLKRRRRKSNKIVGEKSPEKEGLEEKGIEEDGTNETVDNY